MLFYYNRSKKWLVSIKKGATLHTHIGVLSHTDAIGKEYGARITTNKSKYVYLIKPTLYDYTMKLQHGTQIVYPKELGYIAARAGIGSGQKILEIGTGSGSLTSFIANIVKPRGHVYSFDVNDSFLEIAQKNINRAGVTKYVTLHNQDLKKLDVSLGDYENNTMHDNSDKSHKKNTLKNNTAMPVQDADFAIIDLGDPWEVLPQVRKMLKGSGGVFAICPTMNQLEKLVEAFVANEFTDIESTEQIIRNIEARTGKTRHSFEGIGHTTYLCFARKVFFKKHDSMHKNDNVKQKVKNKNNVKKMKTKTNKQKIVTKKPVQKITSKKTRKKSTLSNTKKPRAKSTSKTAAVEKKG